MQPDSDQDNLKLTMDEKEEKIVIEEKSIILPDISQINLSSNRDLASDPSIEITRENWGGKLDFLLSCIGFAVGLGNIWRFPYLCYKYGGGAFLIPYTIFLILCGIPLMFLEMSFGQFASLSPIAIWKICPLFKGLGYGMVIISGLVCIYYNVIIAWTIYFLVHSFKDPLPWSTCNNIWNTAQCFVRSSNDTGALDEATGNESLVTVTIGGGQQMVNGSIISVLTDLMTEAGGENSTVKRVTASEEFWKYRVLDMTAGIENMGTMRWGLLICLVVAWILVLLCLIKGVKSSGKVVYVTAIFPYMVLFILLLRGVTLPGAWMGIHYYLVPKWSRLLEFEVWGAAAMQIFYSVGAAWGALITMSSYNRFKNNCYRDAMVVPLLNCGTSIFAGLVIFSIIGYMANLIGTSVEKVVDQGPGLIFVVYPEALSLLPFSPLWAVLFFMMIFTVGLDSQFGMFETMTSAFVDEFPRQLRNNKLKVTIGMVLLEFAVGTICLTRGGIYFLQIMDWYSSTFSLMVISFFECIVIAWIYGVERFYQDIEMMIGKRPSKWWSICWKYITPFVIMFILIFSLSQHKSVTYNGYIYPGWAIGIGWCFASLSILPLFINAIIQIIITPGSFTQRIRELLQPTPEWGPLVVTYREQYLASLTGVRKERAFQLRPDPAKIAGFSAGGGKPNASGGHGNAGGQGVSAAQLGTTESQTCIASKMTIASVRT